MSSGASSPRPHFEEPVLSPGSNENRIFLVDRTTTAEDPDDTLEAAQTAADIPEDDPRRTSLDKTFSRKWTQLSTQQGRTVRRYARYQEENFVDISNQGDAAARGKRERGKAMVKDLWQVKKIKQAREEDAVVEVLFENQRGFFTFGIPHFASRSLLNFDPKPWTNAKMGTSPVDIHNAQVPDPNWEWAWKSWYVDMSRDVDENGWEYSWAFKGTAWHGTHPWWHSWVRRRRWIRKRVRKSAHHGPGAPLDHRHMADAHKLTPDYFTIHSAKPRGGAHGRNGSVATSAEMWRKSMADDDLEAEIGEVSDVGTLIRLMRKASIDRQKIVLVRNFLRNADDEIIYLADEIPHIMSLMVFQQSRKLLLKLLVEELDRASAHRKEHRTSGKDESDRESRRIDNLFKASSAADREVKKLEYWSDIRALVRDGKTVGGIDDSDWDCDAWQGLDASGAHANETTDAKEKAKVDGKTVEKEDNQEAAQDLDHATGSTEQTSEDVHAD